MSDYSYYVVVGDRRSGKTERILEWLRATPKGETRIWVTWNKHHAQQMRSEINFFEFEGSVMVLPLSAYEEGSWRGISGPVSFVYESWKDLRDVCPLLHNQVAFLKVESIHSEWKAAAQVREYRESGSLN